MTQQRPLPEGTKIDYCGMEAIVIHDNGGQKIKVNCEGSIQDWYWVFEDKECTVVEENNKDQK